MNKFYCNAMAFLATYKKDERGVTAIEYGLIGVAMAVALTAAFASDGSLMTALNDAFAKITANLTKMTGS
ncbi:Flp family type IVb pilin [Shewanella marinintestina]|uniref:Flp family type IVb pilin n=1 Tax=Shewanella marinintestina TaxID=190305 RepID=UPI00200F1304|nr:Flp family type IVb pilin [Shewanella marinintestina]MCL1145372.1 Flp family type IVb pilin [Shewanella marinintestina]